MTRDDLVMTGLENATALSVAFARHWLSLPTVDLIPSRRDFEPERIPGLLANLVIHELISPEHLKLRLVGTAVVDDYGREITGQNYLDFVEPARRQKASRAIFLICEQPAGMLVHLRSVAENGTVLTRESVAFPMRDDNGVARLVYYCSNPATERKTFFDDRHELRVMNVLDRRYIDIGAGLPDFSD
ncbi:PAS domain-containing protein [Thalassobaculum sp. OXR-137]|uniref:PAS domain-containing protein n=1 Tax=Thalassobaculum sp. OXR-137 TaxID=3100173 RepID=UPI002AC9001A|nr:PAS domain-containing protein [Thalassobaculum sp. OXR-137]WPZ36893.1 PAS domain-containing protein [Thalassobaculum sp. OXR-137]